MIKPINQVYFSTDPPMVKDQQTEIEKRQSAEVKFYLRSKRVAQRYDRHGGHVRHSDGENQTRSKTPSCGGELTGYQCPFH